MVMLQLAVGVLLLIQAQQDSTQIPVGAAAQLAQAEARYRSAIALDPGVAAYHESLALVLERQGRIREALASHRQSVVLDSLSARNRTGYGELLLRAGNVQAAIQELTAAARLDPQSVDIRRELAAALVRAQRPQDAAAVLREARTLAPNDSAVLRALASVTPDEAVTTGYHDYSDFDNDLRTGWAFRRILRWVFGGVLALAGIALVGPILGTLLLLVRLPYERLRRRAA
jgi:tetratricopeptide (TPR) repeat protein